MRKQKGDRILSSTLAHNTRTKRSWFSQPPSSTAYWNGWTLLYPFVVPNLSGLLADAAAGVCALDEWLRVWRGVAMAYNPRNHLRGSRGANRRANKTPGQKSAWEREGVWWTLGSSWHKKKELKTRESLLSLLHQKVIFFLLFFCRYLTKRKSKEN